MAPKLQFGVQANRLAFGQEDATAAEIDAFIEEIIAAGVENGHISQAQVGQARRILQQYKQAILRGDDSAIDDLDAQLEAYSQPSRRDFGDVPLFSGALEAVFGGEGAGLPPEYAEDALGIPGARTVTQGGKTYIIDAEGKILDEITGTAAGAGGTPTQRDLEAALAAGIISQEEYNEYQRRRFLGTSGSGGSDQSIARLQAALKAGTISQAEYDAAVRNLTLTGSLLGSGRNPDEITPYQQAQLDMQRERLAFDKLQQQIQAARTAQPLTYLSLLRGAPQMYAGLGKAVPTLERGSGVPEGEAPMPPAMAAIQEGGPVGLASLPAGTLRFEGPQAQRNLTPFELSANTEAREFGGIPEMDQEYQRSIFRRGVGSGLRFGGYGGSLRG
jgi:hypothetical protein